MESYKFSLFRISLCFVLLVLPVSFAHYKTCPDNCVCSCPPPSSGQSPPSDDQNRPPLSDDSPPTSEQNQSPPNQEASPPLSDQNRSPPSQGSPPGSEQNQPPSSQASPPTSQASPPISDSGSPPPTQENSPPTQESDSPPSGEESSPPAQQNSSPPSGQESSPPTQQNSSPPSGQDSSPPTQQSSSPPSGQDSSPPTQQSSSPPTGQDTSPPATPQYGQTPPSSQTPSQGSVVGSFNASFKGSFKRVFAFGDSFTDTGNAFFSGALKAFSGFAGQRMSNGRLVIDFLCDSLDLPPLPAYKKSSADFSSGCNFAIAGSTVLSQDFFLKNQISHTLMWKNPFSVDVQLNWFNDFISKLACKGKGDAECRAEMEGTLFWIGDFGGNDYSRTFGSRIKFSSLHQLAVGHVCRTIKAMIARGAKYIVVQGLPPIGCCPLEMALRGKNDLDPLGCSSIGNAIIKAHNALLLARIAEFRRQHTDCIIVYADTWNAYNTILSNYKRFGFFEPFKACCGAGGGPFNFDLHSLCGASGTSACKNPQQFISWDGIHLTEAMHKHIANLFFHGDFCQPPFEELVKAKIAHHIAH